MKILVYDVAAEDGGGLFVLKNFYEDVRKLNSDIKWTFYVSADVLEPSENIEVKVFEKTKASWLKRLSFETFELPKLIKENDFDLIISLQNMPVRRCNKPQLVYLHQSLQYCPIRFSLFKKDERALALRQKIICGLIKFNIKKSEHIFVQTQWIKKATLKWVGLDESKVSVVPVQIDLSNVPVKPFVGQNSREFFYPARAEIYKNHKVIIEACRILVNRGISDFKVTLTVNNQESPYQREIITLSEGLPIEFIDSVTYADIWEYYSRTILLFPSYLETCGLPMLEAKYAKGRILASDMPFSHEALDGYENVAFFKYDNAEELADKMERELNFASYREVESIESSNENGLLSAMMEFL